ncbi:TnsA endonuclease N terminal [Streptomyces sp. DvalAA-14]|uniref:TnsA-like heteromeric transposase endonuclease subunit n=1 Tax=unclassified Streptomyces TaxID=2593676 RepID=UPI00081B3812|nr:MULTISPECIES: TnsA-like heteromeric transposase endonuclease subunit [unclassified Streptomyces]SCD95827.1 TnsA endonuclease N terminal [Streptomyces sp. DvalAA-14]
MPDSIAVTSADIHVRGLGGDIAVECPFDAVDLEDLLAAGPWRTLRWYKGQKHFSGSFWSATEGALVIYESLLELAWLLEADFDWSVSRIIAQPFLMTARIDGTERKHIPDFLLMTTSGPLVVDVKPAKRLSRPEVAFTFAWSRQVIESRGWAYVVRSEPDSVRLANIRILARHRRAWLFASEIVDRVEVAVTDGVTFADACGSVPELDESLVRSAVLRLMWVGRLMTDLDKPLTSASLLRRRP